MTREEVEKFIDEKFVNLGEVDSKAVYEKKLGDVTRFYAFLAYKDSDVAQKAIDDLNDYKFENFEGADNLYVGFAMPKKMRR